MYQSRREQTPRYPKVDVPNTQNFFFITSVRVCSVGRTLGGAEVGDRESGCENKYKYYDIQICAQAAGGGHLEVLSG